MDLASTCAVPVDELKISEVPVPIGHVLPTPFPSRRLNTLVTPSTSKPLSSRLLLLIDTRILANGVLWASISMRAVDFVTGPPLLCHRPLDLSALCHAPAAISILTPPAVWL